MKIIILIVVLFTSISFAQVELSKEKYDSLKTELDKDTLKNVDTKITVKLSKDSGIKDIKGKDFSFNQTANTESYRMIYSDSLIVLFKSQGYTASTQNIFVGASVDECFKKLAELKMLDTVKVKIVK